MSLCVSVLVSQVCISFFKKYFYNFSVVLSKIFFTNPAYFLHFTSLIWNHLALTYMDLFVFVSSLKSNVPWWIIKVIYHLYSIYTTIVFTIFFIYFHTLSLIKFHEINPIRTWCLLPILLQTTIIYMFYCR